MAPRAAPTRHDTTAVKFLAAASELIDNSMDDGAMEILRLKQIKFPAALDWIRVEDILAVATRNHERGISKKAFHNRWPTREEFLWDAVVFAMLYQDQPAGLHPDPDALADVRSAGTFSAGVGAVADTMLRSLLDHPRTFLLWYVAPYLSHHPEMAATVGDAADETRLQWAKGYGEVLSLMDVRLRPDWSIERISMALQVLLDGFVLRSKVQPDVVDGYRWHDASLMADTMVAFLAGVLDFEDDGETTQEHVDGRVAQVVAGRAGAPVQQIVDVQRWAAFTDRPEGGNPAGVVLDATGMTDAEMLAVAADLGYSETAFCTFLDPANGRGRVRYFSPKAEVPFCGHATIATAVALAERGGPDRWELETRAGTVETVTTADPVSGAVTATLVTVPPRVSTLDREHRDRLLAALRWTSVDLDPALPVRVAYAGASHPVVAVHSRDRLAELGYDYPALETLMAEQDWTTVQIVWRESETVFWSRNPFPPGGVVEDPATGAAAGALGGYLRALGLIRPPVEVTVHQGDDLGRPGLLRVQVPAGEGGIAVSGTAVRIA